MNPHNPCRYDHNCKPFRLTGKRAATLRLHNPALGGHAA